MRSPLTPALTVEYFTRGGKTYVSPCGFHVYEREDDLPQDSFVYEVRRKRWRSVKCAETITIYLLKS